MLKDRFTSLWLRMAARTDVDAAYALIERAYGATQRNYHNLEHIASCLDDFALVRHLAEKPERVEFALWYHDVVYDVTRHDNEAQSAALAGEVGAAAGLTEDCLQEIVELIMATKHDAPPSAVPQQIIVDVDLAILGKPVPEYDRYEANIRREYAAVPEADYRAGRTAILRRFLDRPAIYSTPLLFDRYEQQARTNLQRAVAALQSEK